MSMNLVFVKKVDGEAVYKDFPFQTPTNLTFDVLDAGSKEKRLDLIQNYIDGCDWGPSVTERVMEKIKHHIENGWELTYI